MDIVRVLRILEYTGPRDKIEKQLAKSIHGPVTFNDVTIRSAIIGNYVVKNRPEIMETKSDAASNIQAETVTAEDYTPDQDR